MLIKTLKSDFGNQLNYFFQANDALKPTKQEFDFPLVTIFPRTNNGFFKLDFVAPSPQNFTIQIQDNPLKEIKRNIRIKRN